MDSNLESLVFGGILKYFCLPVIIFEFGWSSQAEGIYLAVWLYPSGGCAWDSGFHSGGCPAHHGNK